MFLKRCDLKIAGLWLGLLTGFVVLACYLMRPDVVGFLYDDGMYLMVAKALAEGHGYRLMGIVDQPYFYKYPPLFPLLLALGWLINPHFPHNIVWLKSINILLATATLALWGYYFRKIRQFPQWICLLLVLILGTNWRFLEVSIDLMSEPLFMLLSSLTIILCHQFQDKNQPFTLANVALLVIMSVAAFYTRTMALPLIMAIGLWLWLTGQRKQAGAYCLGSAVLMLPWFLWSGSCKDTTYALGDFLVRTFQETYFQSFRMDLKYEFTLPELVSKGLQELLGNFSLQFFPILERFFLDKPTLFSESVILTLSFSIAFALGRYAHRQLQTRHFSPEGLYVSLYVCILIFWSFFKAYPRFLMPIAPILWAIFLSILLTLVTRKSENSPRHWAILALLLITLILNGLHIQPYLTKQWPNQMTINTNIDIWQDYSETLTYLRKNTPESSRIYIENLDESYLYALNTDRKTFDHFLFLPMSRVNALCPTSEFSCLKTLHLQRALKNLTLLQRKNIEYIVISHFQVTKTARNNWQLSPKLSPLGQILSTQPHIYKPLFQTKNGLIHIYQFQHL